MAVERGRVERKGDDELKKKDEGRKGVEGSQLSEVGGSYDEQGRVRGEKRAYLRCWSLKDEKQERARRVTSLSFPPPPPRLPWPSFLTSSFPTAFPTRRDPKRNVKQTRHKQTKQDTNVATKRKRTHPRRSFKTHPSSSSAPSSHPHSSSHSPASHQTLQQQPEC